MVVFQGLFSRFTLENRTEESLDIVGFLIRRLGARRFSLKVLNRPKLFQHKELVILIFPVERLEEGANGV